MLNTDLIKNIHNKIDYAFQPIITPSGNTIAFEALIRNTDKIGFETIQSFFNFLFESKLLFQAEIILRKKVIKKFSEIPFSKDVKLFYNHDPRIIEMPDYEFGITNTLLDQFKVDSNSFCLEASELYSYNFSDFNLKTYHRAKKGGFNFALDDFGVAFSNFQMLYYIEPDFIKIDCFFVDGVSSDNKKRFFCQKIVEIGHTIGSLIIGEGVEAIKDYYTLKAIGVDAFQGYLVAKPTTDRELLRKSYENIKELFEVDKRGGNDDSELLKSEIEFIEPVKSSDEIKIVFERLKNLKNADYLPVVDNTGFPVGVIREKDLRNYIYSPFGKDILVNRSLNHRILDFTKRIGVCDIKDSVDKVLNIYTHFLDSEGIIVKRENKYIGIISAKSIVKLVNEKNVMEASNLNPLTKLPGNMAIAEKICKAMEDNGASFHYIIYYDFNNFKPFNDKFGFRVGDRAILGFTDMLRKDKTFEKFIGHIGGDDFVEIINIETSKYNLNSILDYIKIIFEKFEDFIYSFYSESERESGFYSSKDRYGEYKNFNLLDVSAAIVEISNKAHIYNEIEFSNIIANVKKNAKKSSNKYSIVTLY